MTSEGNVADTDILAKANQLIRSGLAPDMSAALKILEQQARNKEERDKIKTTQKAKKSRGSRHSGKKKKPKKSKAS